MHSKRQIRIKHKDKPWVTEALKREIGKRNKLFKIAQRSHKENDWIYWEKQRNLVTDMNRKLKIKHIQNQVHKLIENKQNPQKYHQILKQLMGRGHSSCLPYAGVCAKYWHVILVSAFCPLNLLWKPMWYHFSARGHFCDTRDA